MSKTRIEHREPIIVGFFMLEYAKITMSEVKYHFLSSIGDPNKYELNEIDTDSLYMALNEDNSTKLFDQRCDHCGTD